MRVLHVKLALGGQHEKKSLYRGVDRKGAGTPATSIWQSAINCANPAGVWCSRPQESRTNICRRRTPSAFASQEAPAWNLIRQVPWHFHQGPANAGLWIWLQTVSVMEDGSGP